MSTKAGERGSPLLPIFKGCQGLRIGTHSIVHMAGLPLGNLSQHYVRGQPTNPGSSQLI